MNNQLRKAAQEFEAHTKAAGRGGVSYSEAMTAASRALSKVRQQRGRKSTVAAMVKALGANDVVMTWLYEQANDKNGNGRINYGTTRDLFGKALADWKEDWEISEYDEEWEDLSGDNDLVRGLNEALKLWKPKGTMTKSRDYSAAHLQATLLVRVTENLAKARSYDEAEDLGEALGHAERIVALLK